MIEILDPPVPPDQFAFPSEVFHVAGGAIVESLVGMKPCFRFDPFAEQDMALETSAAGDLVSGVMAFAAIFQTLEVGMRLVKFAGRKLRRQISGWHEQQGDNKTDKPK